MAIEEIATHHEDVVQSLRAYFHIADPLRFSGYTHAEVATELEARLDEIDAMFALNALAAIEAAFRIDYLQSTYLKKKDQVSRKFRVIHKRQGSRVNLDEQILEVWKDHSTASPQLISDLRGAFNYRHWLAHGRYWEPRLGRKYDFGTVYELAEEVLATFPLVGSEVT